MITALVWLFIGLVIGATAGGLLVLMGQKKAIEILQKGKTEAEDLVASLKADLEKFKKD